MNEAELQKALDEATTIEQVRKIAEEVGITAEAFEKIANEADETNGEIDMDDLEQVSGGSWLLAGAGLAAAALIIRAIRKKRYKAGYDEVIMSEKRLAGSCENKE